MEPFFKLLAFAALLYATAAVPVLVQPEGVSSSLCASRCRPDPLFVRFAPNKAYIYQIETQTVIAGASGDSALPVKLSAQAIVSARSQCDLALQLEAVTIGGIADAAIVQTMQSQLEATPFFFGYSDGQVIDVCPQQEEENQWTLNIKKAIVSALQMSATTLESKTIVQERDVLGACQTSYEPMTARYGKTLIKKYKNLRSCSGQQQWLSGFFPRAFTSTLTSVPLISGYQECDQSLQSDLIIGATCREKTSFLNYNVDSYLNLKFVQQTNQISIRNPYSLYRSRNHLKMSHSWTGSQQSAQLVPTLRQLCQFLSYDDQKPTLQAFEQLIRAMKTSSVSEITSAYSSLKNRDICSERKIIDLFLDAAAQSGSEGGAKVLADWIQSNSNDKLRVQMIFQALAFAQEPNAKSIDYLIQVIDRPEAMLGVSGLIHNAKYSEKNGYSFDSYQSVIQQAIDKLIKKLDNAYDDYEKIVIIKALQNIGLEYSPSARQRLTRLAANQQQRDGVRVAALKTLSEALIDSDNRQQVIRLFETESEPNEIRIYAYKAVIMSGATNQEIQRIQAVIARDNNRNVKQYVLSHQKNLRETSDPHKSDIYRHYQQSQQWAEPQQQWMGVSNNFEGSFMIDALGVGAVAETDLIYGRQQSLPTALTINITLPLFGRQVNALEIEVRQKGFEAQIAQKLRQIKGFQDLKYAFEAIESLIYTSKQYNNNDNTFLQIYIKIDSKTIFAFDSKQKYSNFDQIYQKIYQSMTESTDGALGLQPINTRVQLPSTNGWPLILRVNASLVTAIQTQMTSNSAKVSPTLAFKVEAGLEVVAHQHQKAVGVALIGQSAPEWESRHDITNNNMKFKIFFPKQKISFLKVEAEVFGQYMSGSQRQSCSQSTRKPFGIEMCYEQSDNSFEIYAQKSDQSLKSYDFDLSSINNDGSYRYHVMFNTPNSQVERHLEAEVQVENRYDRKSIKANVRSPWIRSQAYFGIANNDKEISMQAEVTHNDRKQLSLDVALEQQSRGQKREYRPRVRLSIGEQREVINLQGSVGISKGRKNQLQINLEGNQKQFLKGSFVREGERKSSDIRLSSDLALQLYNGIEIKVNGLLDKGLKHVTSDLAFEYRFAKQSRKESLKMSLKAQNLSQSSANKLSAFAEVTSTQWPRVNAHVAYNLLRKASEHVENELTVQWGQQMSRRVHVLQLAKAQGGQVENTVSLEISPLNINYELRAEGQRHSDLISATVQGKDKAGSRGNFRAQFAYKHVSRAPLHLTLNANLKTNYNEFEYSDEMRDIGNNHFKGQTGINWQTIPNGIKQSAKMDYQYAIKSNANQLHHEMAIQVDSPFTRQPIKHEYVLRMSREIKHVKSKLDYNDHSMIAEALLSKTGPSKLEWSGLGYKIKSDAHPYQLPQVANIEISTPSYGHKTSFELIPQKALKIKSDTKRNNQNLFALESSIANPSSVVFTSPSISGSFGSHYSNNEKSLNWDLNSASNQWSHNAYYTSSPKAIQIKSKTIAKERPLFDINANYDYYPKKAYLSLESHPLDTTVNAFYSPKSAKMSLISGQKWKHDTNWDCDDQNAKFTSKHVIAGHPIYDLEYASDPSGKSFRSEMAQNYGLDGTWTGTGPYQGSAVINARAKRQLIQHKSTINYDNNDYKKYKFSSQTSKSGRNIAEIESQYSADPQVESHAFFASPYHVSRAYITPAKQLKVEISSPDSQYSHATTVEWRPNYSLDSKTNIKDAKYVLAANHAAKTSFASYKSPMYDISGHVDRDYNTPSAKVAIIGPQVSHVTEVSANRNRKTIRIESKSDRKATNDNIFKLDTIYNHANPSDATTVAMKLAKAKINAKIQPWANIKTINLQAEHPAYFTHTSDLEYHPKKYVTIRSRTNDIQGNNLAKIDSYLSPRDKSHVTIVSRSGDASFEYEPLSGARLDFNNDKWQHKSSLDTIDGLRFESKTKRYANDYLDLSSHVRPATAKLVIKTPAIIHETNGDYNALSLDTKTSYNNQLLNRIAANAKTGFQLETPYFMGDTQWSPSHVAIDYKSRLPRGRHVLGAVRVNPNDKKGFHAEFAWDQQKDPNQKITFDFQAREQTKGWNNKQAIYGVTATYAGNEINIESQMSTNNVLYGPHEWNINYVPKYNADRDRMALQVKHEITNGQMQCSLAYKEANKEKYFASLKTSIENEAIVSSLTTRAPNNPEMELQVDITARAKDMRQRNAQLFAQIKAIRAAKQYAFGVDLKRDAEIIVGDIKYETPSTGLKSLKSVINYGQNQFEASLSDSNGKKAEVKAGAELEQQKKKIWLELKSNIRNIASVAINGEYIPETEAYFRVDIDGARKVDAQVIKSGDINSKSGQKVTASLETAFWPKAEAKTNIKKTSSEVLFESSATVDAKEIFSALLQGQRQANTWSGHVYVSDNAAEVAKAAIAKTFASSNSINYVLNAKNRQQWTPIKVTFSLNDQNRQKKLIVNACAQQNTCADITAAVKYSGSGRVESAQAAITKKGTNAEIKIYLNEEVDDKSSGQSLLQLSSGRIQWKRRNGISVAINGHQMGVDATSSSRGRNQREDEVRLQLPNRKEVTIRSDFSATGKQMNQKVIIEDNSSPEPLIGWHFQTQTQNDEIYAKLEMSSKKFKKSPKTAEITWKKPSYEIPFRVKVDFDLSPNPKNGLIFETSFERKEDSNQKNRYLSSYSAKNYTFYANLYSKDRKKIDVQLSSHISQTTAGITIDNLNARGRRQHFEAFIQSEPISGKGERRFEAYVTTNDNRWAIDGAVSQDKNNQEWTAIWNVDNQKTKEKSEQRVHIGNKCVTWQSRGQQINRKYEVCANVDNPRDKTIQLTLEETSPNSQQAAKQVSANIEVDTRQAKTVRLDLNWTPEAVKQWIKEWQQLNQYYDIFAFDQIWNEIYSEISQKSYFVWTSLTDDIIVPLLSYISDDFSDLFQELVKNFEPFQRLTEVSQQFFYELEQFMKRITDSHIVSDIIDFWRYVWRSARKQCKRYNACYQLVYSLENYGYESLADWSKSNAVEALKATHKMALTTSGRLYRSIQWPQWASQWANEYRQSIYNAYQSIIDVNDDLKRMSDSIEQLIQEIGKEYDTIDATKVKQLFKDLFEVLFISGNSSSRILVWEPKRGRIQIEVKSPAIY